MINGITAQSMSASLITVGSCNSTSYFRVGDVCDFQMTIQVPGFSATDLAIQLISSITVENGTNNSYSLTIAQFYKPSITIGSNYNLTSSNVYTQLTSSTGTSQVKFLKIINKNFCIFNFAILKFDQIDINFGTIYNSNASDSIDANSITIAFSIIVIENGQSNLTSMLITGGAEYYNQTEIWIGQTELIYNQVTTPQEVLSTAATFGNSDPSAISTGLGQFGYFTVPLTITTARYIYLNLSATSISSKLTICSVHIKVKKYVYFIIKNS
jgi:hypothetical protein